MTTEAVIPGICELLLARDLIKPFELERALAFQAAHGGRIGEVLVRMGALSEDAFYAAQAEHLGLSLTEGSQLTEAEIDKGLADWPGLSRTWWARRQALPWRGADDDLPHVAAADPYDTDLCETLAATGKPEPVWHFMLPAALEQWHDALTRRDAGVGLGSLDARALREMAEDAPVIAFVNNVLAQAVEARASDIHLEPGEREFSVRFRIDGLLHSRLTQPIARYAAIASRVKLVSQLDIAERRLPQDGRTSIRVAGAEMDVRVSVIPAVHGESLVLRLLPKERADLRLDRLGMAPDHLQLFEGWLAWPNGLVLVTGPTGSGKSTTLYGALAAINDLSRKIITVEDPVEFRLPNVVQIQTQAEIGYTFARALRSILRHDPDIIMVGEIRDRETAEIAVQSALTGHLVLATLHTNDALSAVTRMVDMGIEPYMVAAALKASMAQRLVRRLCEACAQPDEPADALLQRWQALQARLPPGPLRDQPARWRRAVGCPACQNTGYRGRFGIYELVPVSPAMQHLIAGAGSASALMAMADSAGRRSLVEDGLIRTQQGDTSFDEVLRAAGGAVLE